ncbi:MAG: glycosyltransferase family 2 protein [Clostridium sp.]|uniref:glycosyltransferase family 2 protein n=1 Tax=Clostridium sp. TaxID=1506 RepID=UPI003F3B0D92
MSIRVSIVVPIYNGEKYLDKCLDSILKQTLKEIEIILVNDGSIDNTKNMLDEYSKKDKRIRVINKKNGGPGSCRNIAINSAKGEYIGFVDVDDYIENNMYEKLYLARDNKKIDIVMCNYKDEYVRENYSIKVDHRLISNKIYDEEKINREIISTFSKNENYGFYTMCNKIYRREFILKNKIAISESRNHGEDWLFNIEAFNNAKSALFIYDVLYNYVHINEESLMKKYREEQFDLCLDGRRKMFELIPEELIDKKNLDERFIYEYSSYIIGTFNNIHEKRKRKKIIYDVLKNDEVKDSCINNQVISNHFKVTTNLIRNNMYRSAYVLYKIIWLIKFKNNKALYQ